MTIIDTKNYARHTFWSLTHFFDLCGDDRELMDKRNRPCIIVVKFRYKGKKLDFAVPLRSNTAPDVTKDQYFALPPRPATKSGRRHGIHCIKMFPMQKRFQRRFRTEGSRYYETLQRTNDANTKRIVTESRLTLMITRRTEDLSSLSI